MRLFSLLLALFGVAAPVISVDAGPYRPRESDAAYRSVRQGDILPLHVIRERVRIPGAEFIGADLIEGGARYRLRFTRGGNVLWVDVDARTGRVVGRAGF